MNLGNDSSNETDQDLLQTQPKKRVLIIDDNEQVLRSLRLLIGDDVNVTTAASVAEGKEILEKLDFDSVITDYEIGDGTCFDVIECLGELKQAVPVILITAYGSKQLAIETINKQIFGYLEKPIQPTELKRILAQALDKKVKGEADRKLVKLGLTSGEMLHELSNPLSVVIAKVSLMKQMMKNEHYSEGCNAQLKSIEEALERAQKIIFSCKNQLRGKQYEPFNVEKVFELVKEQCTQRAQQAGVKFEMTAAPNLTGNGDEGQILQILVNLVNNAIDASSEWDDKWVKLRAEVDKNQLHFYVTDSGSGIPESVREKIFSPLFTTKKEKGTGLGLVIVERLVREHGGTISINESSTHTEFVVSLPLQSRGHSVQ